MIRIFFIAIAGGLLFAACGGPVTPTPTQISPPTPTAIVATAAAPTFTATLTPTAALLPTATATILPQPTLVLTAKPTLAPPTPTPEATATPVVGSGPPPIPEVGFVTIANTLFVVDIADNTQERTRGLSGRGSLDQLSGMWFVGEGETLTAFWMQGMNFPIDIIWIGLDLRVVDVTHSASVPLSGATDAEMPRYSPQSPAAFVLEINDGLAELLGIVPGTAVEFSRF
jgi:uncharacterized membrane protein (UPF0127 family)